MYIYEAISLAMAKGKGPGERKHIRRTTPKGWKRRKVELKNGSMRCVLRVKDRRNRNGIFDRRWSPTADDLMADDWELVD